MIAIHLYKFFFCPKPHGGVHYPRRLIGWEWGKRELADKNISREHWDAIVAAWLLLNK
jgi:hypothetical protein